jgi:mediator of RNA polymerase II transcription subunit 21
MSRSIAYLTSRVNFVQVSDEIPVTKQRNPEKADPPDVFEGRLCSIPSLSPTPHAVPRSFSHGYLEQTANKKELVDDLMMKAKQIEYLIQSLPIPEPEEVQVRPPACIGSPHGWESEMFMPSPFFPSLPLLAPPLFWAGVV